MSFKPKSNTKLIDTNKNDVNKSIHSLKLPIGDSSRLFSQMSIIDLVNIYESYQLLIENSVAPISVVQFSAEEALSTPYRYTIEFTSVEVDIQPETILTSTATFNFFAPFDRNKVAFQKLTEPESVAELINTPLRKVHGVITDFARLSTSKDESRYRVVLQPHLALLDNQRNYAIYQNKTVHQVVEAVLREHHFQGAYFSNQSIHTYPTREFFCQWNETDLQFIQRLCSEVGVWYRFEMDPKLNREVIVFGDDLSKLVHGLMLPNIEPSNLNDNKIESVWALVANHQVVEASVTTKDYNYRDPKNSLLNTEAVRTVVDMHERHCEPYTHEITYGDAYHYQDNVLTEGTGFDPNPESGKFFAKLRHERYLNAQTRITGMSTSQNLKPGDILTVQGRASDIPSVVANGMIVVRVNVDNILRDGSYVLRFEGIPYREHVGFRPDLLPKPVIAGTIPATIVHRSDDETYAWLDEHGRYHVKFNFDLNSSWKKGYSSLAVRLAKPYAGDTYGWHFPLLAQTEVQIAFINSDPDQPYIAHVMHNHHKPDHVNSDNNTRNVIRTPSNNKLRMEDRVGEEHVKIQTEYSKTQLNLGHIVNNQRQKRGEGFELRSDEWGAIRAAKGLLLSSTLQPKAQGNVLDIETIKKQLADALVLAESLSTIGEHAELSKLETEKQSAFLENNITDLAQPVIVVGGVNGIALSTPNHIQQSANGNLIATAGGSSELSVLGKIALMAKKAVTVFAHEMGIKLVAAAGNVQIQAQHDAMELTAVKGVTITSTEDEIIIYSPKKITLDIGESYLSLSANKIEYATKEEFIVKSSTFEVLSHETSMIPLPSFAIPNSDKSVISPQKYFSE